MPASDVPPVPALPIRVAAGTTAAAALREAGVELNGPGGAVVVRDPDGVLKDLDWAPEADTDVEAVSASSPDGLAVLRHSAAHVMAQAVQDLFPGTLLGIGPPIEDGFYYDFLPERPFTPEDLAAIEKKMAEIIKAGQRFDRRRHRRRRRAHRARAREVQARADRAEVHRERRGGDRGRCRRADHVRQPRREVRRPRLDRPVPRPAPAHHPTHPGVQADAQRGRLLARQREEPAAAAHLRHRLGLARRPEGLPLPARGGRQARPPQARRRARPVQLPRRDRLGLAGLPPARAA